MINERLLPQPDIAPSGNLPSGYFNTVTYTGTGAAQKIGGYINRAAVFNGSSSYIYRSASGFPTGNNSRSISLWVDNKNTINAGIIGYGNTSTAQAFYLYLNAQGKLGVYGYYYNYDSNYTLPTNQWVHLVITHDGTTTRVYANGTEQFNLARTFNTGTNYFRIGGVHWNNSSEFFNGKIDQVRIFNKALSTSEVTTLSNETHSSTTISTTDIFNDNSGVALYQLDGNANDTGGASGKFGSGAIFTGGNASTGSKISISNDVYGSSTSVFSASIWVNSNTNSGEIPLIGNGGTIGGTTGYAVYLNNGELTLTFRTNPNQNFYYTNTSLYQQGWKHIVLTVNDGAYVLYLDGTSVLNGTTTNWSSNPTPTYDTFIGNRWNRNESGVFDGIVDEIRIYSDVLTSTEVGYLYNNTTASIPTDNLQAYYKLNGDARDEQQLYDGAARNVTYAYDGTATNVTYQEATAFQPDLVWIKSRGATGSHILTDSVRGNGKELYSDLTNAEGTVNRISITSNGFELSNTAYPNQNGSTFAAWCFKGGGPAVNNTDGTITSSVSANQDAGFSIATWTGDNSASNIGHGLGGTPELMIIKNRTGTNSWVVGVPDVLGTGYLILNGTGAASTTNIFGQVPDDTKYYFNTAAGGNGYLSSGNYVGYFFRSIDGYSKVGSYTGNGSTSGPIVETGFEPAFIMMKATDLARNWVIVDNKRGYGNNLSANTNLAEYLTSNGQGMEVQFLSNGFQIETSSSWINNDTTNYIYLAIAADPDTTTPTVENSFDVVTYDGRSTFGTVDVETDFKPDLVWIKCRGTGHNNYIVDSIRGADKVLSSNLTASDPAFTPDEFTSFNENGFTVNFASGGGRTAYSSDGPYVAWCWKAGDHDENLPQINTEGTIDSTVSVNAEAGFSIVKYTGDGNASSNVGHGLSVRPELTIFKQLSSGGTGGGYWNTYYTANNTVGFLNATNAFISNTGGTNGSVDIANMNSTKFGFLNGSSSANNQNGSGLDYIVYCFHSVTGYQKIGSYTGNNTTNVVTTGFQPRFVMVKASSHTSSWYIVDSSRTDDKFLSPDLSNAEYTDAGKINFTSTGFTLTSTSYNNSGYTWIYLAIK